MRDQINGPIAPERLVGALHDRAENTELHEGRWRPSVPLPFYGPCFVRCSCGRRFWLRDRAVRYGDHHRAEHERQ